jgi:hypothetical protein
VPSLKFFTFDPYIRELISVNLFNPVRRASHMEGTSLKDALLKYQRVQFLELVNGVTETAGKEAASEFILNRFLNVPAGEEPEHMECKN